MSFLHYEINLQRNSSCFNAFLAAAGQKLPTSAIWTTPHKARLTALHRIFVRYCPLKNILYYNPFWQRSQAMGWKNPKNNSCYIFQHIFLCNATISKKDLLFWNEYVIIKNMLEWRRKPYTVESYRSGHNELHSKCSCPQGHVGSNPTLSAIHFFKKPHRLGFSEMMRLFCAETPLP